MAVTLTHDSKLFEKNVIQLRKFVAQYVGLIVKMMIFVITRNRTQPYDMSNKGEIIGRIILIF